MQVVEKRYRLIGGVCVGRPLSRHPNPHTTYAAHESSSEVQQNWVAGAPPTQRTGTAMCKHCRSMFMPESMLEFARVPEVAP